MNQYLIFAVGGVFGIALHILFKLREMNEMLPNETYGTVFKAYFKKGFISLLISVVTVLAVMYMLAGKIPAPDEPDKTGDSQDWLIYNLLKYLRFASIVIGYFSDSILYAIFNKVGKKLADKGIDVKP